MSVCVCVRVCVAYHGIAEEEGQIGDHVLARVSAQFGSRILSGALNVSGVGGSWRHVICMWLVVQAIGGLVCRIAGEQRG